jgi:hypothetical protein
VKPGGRFTGRKGSTNLELGWTVEPTTFDQSLHEEEVEGSLAPAGEHGVVAVVQQGHALLPAPSKREWLQPDGFRTKTATVWRNQAVTVWTN